MYTLNGIRAHDHCKPWPGVLPTELSSQLGGGQLWVQNLLVDGEECKWHIWNVVGEQKLAHRLIITVVSCTFLKCTGAWANLKQNVGTFLAFFCSSNRNEWYVSFSCAILNIYSISQQTWLPILPNYMYIVLLTAGI